MKRKQYFLASLALICVAGVAWLTPLHARGPKGSGDTPMTNPALVFLKESAIISIATADGLSQQDLSGGSKGGTISRGAPTWSPDGKFIAYLEATYNDDPPYPKLYVMNADGSNPTLIHTFSAYPTMNGTLTWLPGDVIHFDREQDAHFLDLYDGSVYSLGLRGLRFDDNQRRFEYVGFTSVGPGVVPYEPGAFGLLAFNASEVGSSGTNIYIAEVVTDSEGTLQLDPPTIRSLNLPGAQTLPVISPDGLQIAFYDDAGSDGGRFLKVVNLIYTEGEAASFDSGSINTLFDADPGRVFVAPTWSPDSQWIAFTWAPNENPKRAEPFQIARIRWNGTGFTNVTNNSNHYLGPNWNPAWDPAK